MTRLKSFALGLMLANAISIGAQVQIIPAPFNGTWAVNNIVTTSTDGFLLQNTTAATAGVPVQISPRLRFRSNVWNTTATAATNTDDAWIESIPLSSTTPSSSLVFKASLNGGTAINTLTVGTFPTSSSFAALWMFTAAPTTGNYALLSSATLGGQTVLNGPVGDVEVRVAGTTRAAVGPLGLSINGAANTAPTIPFQVSNTAKNAVLFSIADAGAVSVGTNMTLRGSVPTVTGGGSTCGTSAPSIAGTDTAGKVTTGSVAPTVCVVTFSSAWTNAPACQAANETTGNLLRPTSTTTTLTLTGTMVAADVLAYTCVGY